MSNIEDTVWAHLVEHHAADRVRVRVTPRAVSRRPRLRPVMLGATVTGLAAVAAGVVVTTASSGPSSRAVVTGSAHSGTTMPGGVGAQDTAYVITRVKARLAAQTNRMMTEIYQYPDGAQAPDGSLLLRGRVSLTEYVYGTPDVVYTRVTHSSTGILGHSTQSVGNGSSTLTETYLDPADRTYSSQQTTTSVPRGVKLSTGTPSDAAAVQRALQSGRLTEIGTPTFDGTAAIALSMRSRGYTETLYVDAHTYAPLALVDANPDHDPAFFDGLYITEFLPLSQANIAKAMDPSIPAGYRKVADVR